MTIFLQCFGLLHDSVKNFFACGGLKVRRHSAWLSSCCLPAADRVVQLIIRRCGVCIGSVARFGVVEIKRGISAAACACVRDMDTGSRSARSSRRRVGCGVPRHARPPQPAWRSLRLAADDFLLGSIIHATGAFWGWSRRAACARVFLKDFAFRRFKTRIFFRPRGALSTVTGVRVSTADT